MKKIRVGLIRCDLHGIYYAALFAKHDAKMLARDDLYEGKRYYSWQTGGAHLYHYNFYADPYKMTAPHVGGMELVKIWEQRKGVGEIAAKLFTPPPKVCKTFEEVSDDVDMVFIADCNLDGSDHLKLATPGIKKRVPTFIDKPFAHNVKDATALVRLAKRCRTPILSMSILRSVPQATQFGKRFSEVGGACFGTVKGGGLAMAGQIHAVSLAQHVFGNGVTAVSAMGEEGPSHWHLDYGTRKDRPERGVVVMADSGGSPHCAFYVSAYGRDSAGAIHSPQIGDWVFPWGAAKNLELAKKMVRTGKPPVDYNDMIENVAVVEAVRKAWKLGRTVKIRDVWRKRS